MNKKQSKCGYIAIIGRPNAGKSTFLNAVMGEKLAGVSVKPQTTRHRILGVKQIDESQLLFLDSPGLHRLTNRAVLNSFLNREAWQAVADADVICYMVDGSQGWQVADTRILSQLATQANVPIGIMISKCDKVKKAVIAKHGQEIEQTVKEILENRPQSSPCFYLSSKQKPTLEPVLSWVADQLPTGEFLFPADQVTDRDDYFLAGEYIREQLFRCLGQEIPYQCAVAVDSLQEKDDVAKVAARIIVARASQKGMIIGNKGSKIKEIGAKSRRVLEDHWGQQVFLELRVEVENGWHEDKEATRRFGLFE